MKTTSKKIKKIKTTSKKNEDDLKKTKKKTSKINENEDDLNFFLNNNIKKNQPLLAV
jgi:hypothetical protein